MGTVRRHMRLDRWRPLNTIRRHIHLISMGASKKQIHLDGMEVMVHSQTTHASL